MDFNINQRITWERLILFAKELIKISDKVGFKQSARGWCYQLEVEGIITKAEFDRVEFLINKCRREGVLPIDFTAEEEGRKFSGVEVPTKKSPLADLREWVVRAMRSEEYYTPDWWDGEEYYIQMLVEKIDLKTLFKPVCRKYHIPIATSKGWSSMLQRAIYAKRFRDAEDKGLKPLLLYCGDHDPDGLRISDFIRKNLEDLSNIAWGDKDTGYDPENLLIVRFGLNYDFIETHNLSWIPNLITGGKAKKCLSDPSHKNNRMDYVQDYISKFGVRKCEANAIVTIPDVARDFVEATIKSYLGEDALDRFEERYLKIVEVLNHVKEESGITKALQDALDLIDERGG